MCSKCSVRKESETVGTVNTEKQLERIADALEGINNNLGDIANSLKSLDECVGYMPPRYYQTQGYYPTLYNKLIFSFSCRIKEVPA